MPGAGRILTCADPHEALEVARVKRPAVVLTDIRMPRMDGLELLERLRKLDPSTSVIVMTAYGSIEYAVEAVKKGAYDFICKPFDYEQLFAAIQKGLERTRLIRENITLRRRVSDRMTFGYFIGQSAVMRRFYETIQAVARTDYTVLVRGESGTGKELTAKAIHAESRRAANTIVMVNCPAIPEHLLESELFGHAKGAFTGATGSRKGLFEEADGGTICLDEIGDIPVNIQTKLLRVLQEGEIRPLGSDRTKKVDVRVVAATNQNLEDKIRQGAFRQDLYYRLNVVCVRTPSLQEIREDIPLLVSHFSRLACHEQGVEPKRFTAEAIDALASRPWPGNVRQLQNEVRRLVMFCRGPEIGASDLALLDPVAVPSPAAAEAADGGIIPYKEAKEQVLARFSRGYLERLFRETAGNVSRSSELAGLSRAALQKIIKRFRIDPGVYRRAS